MQSLIVYNASGNSSSRLATRLRELVNFDSQVRDVGECLSSEVMQPFDLLLFLCPTYGDQELQADMETFSLVNHTGMVGKQYAVVSMGTYDGYDWFEPMGGMFLHRYLQSIQCEPILKPDAILTFPFVDWPAFDRWVDKLNAWHHLNVRH